MRTLPRRSVVGLVLALVAIVTLLAVPTFSYLPMFTRSTTATTQPDHWDLTAFQLIYDVNPAVGSNITGSVPAPQVVDASFMTWTTAPNIALQITRGPDSNVATPAFDGLNLICFTCSDTSSFGTGIDTLAVTITTTADAPGQNTKHGGVSGFAGQILDADILFNPAVQWSTDANLSGNQQQLQTVATHEIGHFFGLDHSAVVAAVMYPFAPPIQTTLGYDDVAGMSTLYTKSSPDVSTGILTGTIRFGSGAGVFGAHVFADSNTNNLSYNSNIRKTPIGTLTRPDGTYSIAGLPPDSYTVTVEPLDEPVTNGDVQGYSSAFGQPSVQTNFGTKSH